MTGRTGAEVVEVAELRRVLGRRADDIAGEAADVGAAIDRFRLRSSEYVPHVPDHRTRGAHLAGRLDELGFRVERSRDALAAADRWVTTRMARTAVDLESLRRTVVGVPHTLQRAGPGTLARVHRWRFDRAVPERLTTRQVRFGVPGARGLPRREVVALRDDLNRTNRLLRQQHDDAFAAAQRWSRTHTPVAQWHDTVADLRRVAGRGASAGLRGEDAATTLGRGWATRVSGSRVAAVGRIGSRAVGVAGVALGGWDVVQGVREGDTEQAVTGGLSTLAGVAMMTPIPGVQVAGAIVAGGLLVYEHREQIAAALDAAGDATAAAQDMVGAAWDAVTGLF